MSDEVQEGEEIELDQALLEFMRRFDAGQIDDRESFLQEFPDLAPRLRVLLDAADWIEKMAGPTLGELATKPFDGNSETIAPTPKGTASPQRMISIDESTLPPDPHLGDFVLSSVPSFENSQSILPYRFGDYVLERVLGRGGMGVVYLAFQVQLERKVALKMIRSGALASQDEMTRFYTEARSAASLTHPNIVSVYHCGEIDGHHFFTMDFVPGTDLSKRLDRGPMAPREAVRYVRDVARAIHYAHERGVVHRDLKPANVLIDEADEVMITDFGLAKQMDSDQGLTATGAALGTPSYMSPEQAAGKSEEQGASTDVYAMGAILYALLTGKPPFSADSVLQTMLQVIHRTAPTVRLSNPNIHVDLDTIVIKCLEKSPGRRYATAGDLADDLDRFYQGIPITARPPSMPRRVKHFLAHVPLVAAITGVRNVEPSRSQRVAQNVMIATALMSVILWLTTGSVMNYWRDHSMPSHLTIASGTPGGMYFELAGKLAERFNSSNGDSRVVATNGSLENLKQLEGNKAQMALMQESSVRSDQVAVVAPLFYEAVHVLVPGTSEIHTLQDLIGKRIAMGAKDSGTRQAAIRLLKQFGVTPDKITVLDTDWTQLDHIKDADAVIAVIRAGQSGMADLLKSNRYRLLSIENASRLALTEPMFRVFSIPEGTYENSSGRPIETLATTALLVVRRDAPSRLVEECLKVVYERTPASDGFIPVELAANWQGLPYHEAARKYFAPFEGAR
jgi:eukaryotic-like serine/threonine-protein kinase